MINLRHPTRILYVRYSSRSWGASLFRGSCLGISLDVWVEPRGRSTYEFDSDLLVVQEVCALKNHTKGSFANFLAHAVVDTHHVGGRGGHGGGMKCWRPGEEKLITGQRLQGRKHVIDLLTGRSQIKEPEDADAKRLAEDESHTPQGPMLFFTDRCRREVLESE